jgi:MoxR-like ATPase
MHWQVDAVPDDAVDTTAGIDEIQSALRRCGYIAGRHLATAIFLAQALERPLLLEGEPGVGKTEVARALAHATGRRLIRLQGYEGLDIASAVYEWNYAKQILAIRAAESRGVDPGNLYDLQYLNRRPILDAIDNADPEPPILLIDEVDRADQEFEAYLLEVLANFEITVPEVGTLRADRPPFVLITSNRTRELHDALKRRCLYQWIEFPDFQTECEIVASRVPEVAARLREQTVSFVQALRRQSLYKAPGPAESIDLARGLAAMNASSLSQEAVDVSIGLVLKNQEDVQTVRSRLSDLVHEAAAEAG